MTGHSLHPDRAARATPPKLAGDQLEAASQQPGGTAGLDDAFLRIDWRARRVPLAKAQRGGRRQGGSADRHRRAGGDPSTSHPQSSRTGWRGPRPSGAVFARSLIVGPPTMRRNKLRRPAGYRACAARTRRDRRSIPAACDGASAMRNCAGSSCRTSWRRNESHIRRDMVAKVMRWSYLVSSTP